jgi:hypothetical protein
LIFVTNKENILHSGVGEHFLDQDSRYHIPIYCFFLNLTNINKKLSKGLFGNIKRGDDYEKLRNNIQATNWNNCFETDINIYTNKMTDRYLDIAKVCIPNKMIYVRPSDIPWMTSTIQSHIRIRNDYIKS